MGSRNHNRRAAGKLLHIGDQIQTLERAQAACPWGDQPAPQAGGSRPATLADQIKFQRWRHRLAQRCLGVPKRKVHAWLKATMAALSPDEQARIGGDVRGLSAMVVRAIVAAEIYLIVLGEHPGQKGG